MSEALPYRATAAGATYDEVARLPVSVLLDNVRSAYNVGAFFRTLDAVGGTRIFVSGITPTPAHRGVAKTALGAEATLPWSSVDDVGRLMDELHESSVTIAAIETSVTAVDLFDWQPSFPACVVFGHEVDGIGPSLMAGADVHVRLPMLGRKQSLNVATAGGVVLFELLRKYRAAQLAARRA